MAKGEGRSVLGTSTHSYLQTLGMKINSVLPTFRDVHIVLAKDGSKGLILFPPVGGLNLKSKGIFCLEEKYTTAITL